MKVVDEQHEKDRKPDDVIVSDVTIDYSQEPDSCSSSEEYQSLKISTDDAGGGKFMVISTERWAFNSVDDLIKVIEDFKRRSGMSLEDK